MISPLTLPFKEIGIRAAQNLVFLGITMWIAKKLLQWAVDAMDPTSKEKIDAQQRADKLLEQIGIQVILKSQVLFFSPPLFLFFSYFEFFFLFLF